MPADNQISPKSKHDTITNRLDKSLFVLLLLLLIWLPLPLGSNRPWAWGIMQLASYTLMAGCLVRYWHDLVAKLVDYRGPVTLFAIFTTWTIVQTLSLPEGLIKWLSPLSHHYFSQADADTFSLSVDPAQTQIAFYKSLAYFCLFVVCLLLINSAQRVKQVMLCMFTAGVFQAVYGSIEVLSGWQHSLVFSLPIGKAASGSFVYKNHYANFLLLSAAMGIGYLISSMSNANSMGRREQVRSMLNAMFNGKVLVRVAIAMIVIGLVLSRSRMGNTAFFAALALSGTLGLLLIRQKSRGLVILLVSMLLIDLLIVSSWFGLQEVGTRLMSTTLSEEVRLSVWQAASPLLDQVAMLGSGGGSFYTVFSLYQSENIFAFYDHAHNDYLQFTLEYGLLATSALAVLVTYSLLRATHAMARRQHPVMCGVAFASQMAIMGTLIHMSTDFPLQSPANAVYFIVSLSLALSSNNIARRLSQVAK